MARFVAHLILLRKLSLHPAQLENSAKKVKKLLAMEVIFARQVQLSQPLLMVNLEKSALKDSTVLLVSLPREIAHLNSTTHTLD